MKRKRVIVISYDDDQQRSHFDMLAVADTPDFVEEAKRIVGISRQYASVVDVLDPDDIERMKVELENQPEFDLLPFAEFVSNLPRERCIELLTEVGIRGGADDSMGEKTWVETDTVLREAVRSYLEDETIIFSDIDGL